MLFKIGQRQKPRAKLFALLGSLRLEFCYIIATVIVLLQRALEPVLWGQKDVIQFQIKWDLVNTNNTYFILLV